MEDNLVLTTSIPYKYIIKITEYPANAILTYISADGEHKKYFTNRQLERLNEILHYKTWDEKEFTKKKSRYYNPSRVVKSRDPVLEDTMNNLAL